MPRELPWIACRCSLRMRHEKVSEPMRITNVKTWIVEGIKYNWVILKVFTDSGITGIGEGNQLARESVDSGGVPSRR
jgi:hypothetical protein